MEWLPTPVLLPGEFHEQRSLAGKEEKGATEDGIVEWHHQLNGHESEQVLRDCWERLRAEGEEGLRG